MTQAPWRRVVQLLRHPDCQGAGPIQLVAEMPFYEHDDLPFDFVCTGIVCHVIPERGFRKANLAATEDEKLLIVDCPDDEGWLAPDDLVGNWLARNVSCPELEDILVSHPLYEYLTRPDDEGRSRGGHRGELVQWAPGMPNLASLYSPEFLPNDPEAPRVNRDREAYAEAVIDLIEQLDDAFELVEIELGVRFGDEPPAPEDGGDDDLRAGSYTA